MGNEKSIEAVKNYNTSRADQVSALSRDTIIYRQANIKMVQNILVIWVDNTLDSNSTNCQNSINQLHRVINDVNVFVDSDECLQFLEKVPDEKICMIISGTLALQLVPRVHKMSQVVSILLITDNKKRHDDWAKDWGKIRGVYTDMSSICNALKPIAQQCEQNTSSISFITAANANTKKSLDGFDPSFIYAYVLKEILLGLQFYDKHFREFIDFARDALGENPTELQNVDKLKKTYRDKTPIWWFTNESFLYPMVNRALRVGDADLIIKLGFFINDLHRQIEQLHKQQFGEQTTDKCLTVYRGQGMDMDEFEKMMKTRSGLLSFNSFLSTTKNQKIALNAAHRAMNNPYMMGIVFVMSIDPSKTTTPFASIADVASCENKEDMILFSMQTVFRISNVKVMGENPRLFQVDLKYPNVNDEDVRLVINRVREETFSNAKGWYRFGLILFKMGHWAKAQEVHHMLLEQTTRESEKAPIYAQLGRIKRVQKDYKEAIRYYEKSIEIEEAAMPRNNRNLATAYTNIALVYENTNESTKALAYYEKALAIRQQSLPATHVDLATTYNSIGNVYYSTANYLKARSFYTRAVEIGQQSLPKNHPNLVKWKKNVDKLKNKV